MTVMDDLYASEINARISWFYDAGFTVELGDDLNGIENKSPSLKDWGAVEAWLIYRALELYPGSEFAKKYRTHTII